MVLGPNLLLPGILLYQNIFLNKSDKLCINITLKGIELYFLVVYSQFVLRDHNCDKKSWWTGISIENT